MLYSRRDIPTKIVLTSRENYFPHMTDSQRVICADLMESLLQLATKTSFENDKYASERINACEQFHWYLLKKPLLLFSSTNKNVWDTKLFSMLTTLEDQIRELKTHCYRSLVSQRASKICGFRIKRSQKRL